MRQVVYDSGFLIQVDRGIRDRLAEHRLALEGGIVPMVPAGVVAQVSRSPQQVQLRRLLASCAIVDLSGPDAHAVGALLGRTGTSDVVDGHVALVAARVGATVLTTDPDDLDRLASELGGQVRVVEL